jgi:hypothetical protein
MLEAVTASGLLVLAFHPDPTDPESQSHVEMSISLKDFQEFSPETLWDLYLRPAVIVLKNWMDARAAKEAAANEPEVHCDPLAQEPLMIEKAPEVQRAAPIRIDFTRATELTPEVEAAIDDAFEYHKWTPAQVEAGSRVRRALADAVKIIVADVPPGPDRTVAIRKIRDSRMDCNSAITHGGKL